MDSSRRAGNRCGSGPSQNQQKNICFLRRPNSATWLQALPSAEQMPQHLASSCAAKSPLHQGSVEYEHFSTFLFFNNITCIRYFNQCTTSDGDMPLCAISVTDGDPHMTRFGYCNNNCPGGQLCRLLTIWIWSEQKHINIDSEHNITIFMINVYSDI